MVGAVMGETNVWPSARCIEGRSELRRHVRNHFFASSFLGHFVWLDSLDTLFLISRTIILIFAVSTFR